MRIKKIKVWDESHNLGYDHAVIEIKGEGFPENLDGLCFSIERPGYAEPYLSRQPMGNETAWAGADSERTRLDPEGHPQLSGDKLCLTVGPSVVRQMSKGNYTLKLMDGASGPLAKKVMVWDVKTRPGVVISPPPKSPIEDPPYSPPPVQEPEPPPIVDPPPKLPGTESPPGPDPVKDTEPVTVLEPEPAPPQTPAAPPEQPSVRPPEHPPKTSKKAKSKLILLVVPVLLVALSVAGWLYLNEKEKSPPQQAQQGQPPSTPQTLLPEEVLDACQEGTMPADKCYASAQRILKDAEAKPDPDRVATVANIFEQAADQGGLGDAYWQLGRMYDPHDFTDDRRTQRPPDENQAHDYYRKAIEKGTAAACEDMVGLHAWWKERAMGDHMMKVLLQNKTWDFPSVCR